MEPPLAETKALETPVMNPAPSPAPDPEVGSLWAQAVNQSVGGETLPADREAALTPTGEQAAFQALNTDWTAETAPVRAETHSQTPDWPEQEKASAPGASDTVLPQTSGVMTRRGEGSQTQTEPIQEASLQGAVPLDPAGRETLEGQSRIEASVQPDGLTQARADGLTQARADGLTQAQADGLAQARADGLAQAQADGLTQAQADGLAQAQADGLTQARMGASLPNRQDPDARQKDPEGGGSFKQALAEGLQATSEAGLNATASDTTEARGADPQGLLLQLLNQPSRQVYPGQEIQGGDPNAFAREMPLMVLQSVRSFEGAEGAKEVVIQLAPAELGHLTVRLVSQDGLLAIRILAHSPMTQRVLETGLAGLKQALDQQGIRYERIEVELDGYQMGHHQSGEEQASAWTQRQNPGAYDRRQLQGSDLYESAEDRMSLKEAVPGETGGAEAAYEGQVNYVV
jgi:flagellar hook-length control protein FliK